MRPCSCHSGKKRPGKPAQMAGNSGPCYVYGFSVMGAAPLFTARSPRLEPLRRASCGLVRNKQSGSQPANQLPRKCRTTTQGPECYAMPNIQGSVAAEQRFHPLHHILPFFVRASWASWTFLYFQRVAAAQFGFAILDKPDKLLAE